MYYVAIVYACTCPMENACIIAKVGECAVAPVNACILTILHTCFSRIVHACIITTMCAWTVATIHARPNLRYKGGRDVPPLSLGVRLRRMYPLRREEKLSTMAFPPFWLGASINLLWLEKFDTSENHVHASPQCRNKHGAHKRGASGPLRPAVFHA